MKEKATILFAVLFMLFSNQISAENSSIAPPANDDCAGAIELTVNSNFLCGSTSPGTVFDATASSSPNVCPNSATNANNDVWFKFEALETTHKIELLNISGSQTNLYHSVFDAGPSGDCSTLTAGDNIFCSDPNSSTLTSLTVGNVYFIRVYTNDALAHDTTFDVCVGSIPSPPANDDCANAETVSSFPFNNSVDATSATNNAGFIDVSGCGGAMNDGVWYTFVGDGSNITVTVTPAAWDAKIGIYTGTCGTFTCITDRDTGLEGSTETVTFTSTASTTYYVNIGHPSGAVDMAEGIFDLEISASGLSIDDLVAKGFSYYPNPVREELKMSANEDIKSINVYNMIGQEVKRIVLSNVSSYKLDMSDLSKGLYFITAEIGESSGTFKIIKK